ncbi:uncharacterized protein [Dendrobates tinctorius]|uniref:uncharacterized protein isoform X2 n=1 Tax=Dendrobates tinctorius TaxID=92724 RepID=UPI003CCA4828
MVLKDIKNEPSVTSGLKRPLSWLKRRMSNSGCPSSLPCDSKFGKGDVEQDLDCASADLRSEQNLNSHTDRTNTILSLQDKEGNASLLDPTASSEGEEQDPTDMSMNKDKYFSTPMPSRERVKKKLTPVMEVDSELNMSDESQPQDRLSTIDLLHKKSYPTDVLLHESPTKTPLYRSFFATECQEIVNQIVTKKPVVRTPGSKRKVEELDLSTIDAEPPPYDTTPMKSMLACEVDKVISSLENSPVNEGLSLFGVSLLDLEKTDMQLNDFNLSECQIQNNTRCAASNAEGLSLLNELNGVCSKRLKMEPLEKNNCEVNQEDKILSPLAISATSKSSGENITQVFSNSILHTEPKLSDVVMTRSMASPQVVNQVMKTSPQTLVITTNNPVCKGPSTTCIKQMDKSNEHNLCASTAQDIEETYELPPTDTTHEIEKSKVLTDPWLSIISIHEEMTIENATRVTEILPPTSNTTQDIPFIQEEVNLTNTKQVIEMVGPPANTTLDISSVHDGAISGDITQVMDVVPLSANTTHDLTPVHEGVTAANTTQITDMAPQILANGTQDIPFTLESKATNTTQVEMVGPPANTALDISSGHDGAISGNITHVMDVVPHSANTTHDLTPEHERVTAATANTMQITDMALQILANGTQDLPFTESKAANTMHEIEVVTESCVNATHIAPVYMAATPTNTTQYIEIIPKASADRASGKTAICDVSVPTCCTQDTGGMQESFVVVPRASEATATPCTDPSPKALCAQFSLVLQTTANHSNLCKEETQPCLNMTLDAPARHSDVICDISLTGATGTKAEISISNSGYSLNADNEGLMVNDCRNVSKLDPKREALVVDDGNDLPSVAPNAQALVVTCVTTGPSILVSPPVQANPNVTEGQKLEGSQKCGSNCDPGMMASPTEVDICKESGNQPSLSESCSMLQEEENAHDISVFSVGSLSFVTSTPVPGINDFQYQKTVMDPMQQDPSLSIGSVFDESANKVSRGPRMNTPHDTQGLHCKDQLEVSHGSSIPLRLRRGLVPPSEAMPKTMASTSGIPSARRSLVLCQNPARETAVSKIAQRGGIPVRGILRPPMVRQSLPRASLGNPKLAMESMGGSVISKSTAGSRFRAPKAAALKVKSAMTDSQLPPAPSSDKPQSRLGIPGPSRQLSIGSQNAVLNLHDAPSVKTVSGVRPPTSTGTGLIRPGTSSVRPPLPQSQKASPKLKTQVQGLAAKKNPREIPTFGCRREIGTKAEGTSVRASARQPPPALGSATEASSQASPSLINQTAQTKVENLSKEQCSRFSKPDVSSVPSSSTELADSGHDRCRHLEICKCCHERHQQLLREIEDLKIRFGII